MYEFNLQCNSQLILLICYICERRPQSLFAFGSQNSNLQSTIKLQSLQPQFQSKHHTPHQPNTQTVSSRISFKCFGEKQFARINTLCLNEGKVWKLRLVMGFHPSNNVCYEGLDTCTSAMLIFNAHKWCTFQHFCKIVRLCEEWRQALKKHRDSTTTNYYKIKTKKTHQTAHMHISGVFHLTVNMK